MAQENVQVGAMDLLKAMAQENAATQVAGQVVAQPAAGAAPLG